MRKDGHEMLQGGGIDRQRPVSRNRKETFSLRLKWYQYTNKQI